MQAITTKFINPTNSRDAVTQEAREIVQRCVNALLSRIKEGEITDEESLSDAMCEEIDSALIYTADQYVCAWGLKDVEDAFEEGFISKPSNFVDALAAQALCNLRSAVQGHDFSDALAVREDAELEGGES